MKPNNIQFNDQSRRGTILILTAFLLVFMISLLALAIDVGYMEMAKVQLQQSADAAALAAAAELTNTDPVTGVTSTAISKARSAAVQYAGLNKVCQAAPAVSLNTSNTSSGDIVIGYRSDPTNRTQPMDFTNPSQFNAVQVTVQRTTSENGEVKLFFARLLGANSKPISATATAAVLNSQSNLNGFQAPTDGSNLPILPFAFDKQTWDKLIAGTCDSEISDNWTWDESTQTITHGADNVREVNLYPGGGTSSSCNNSSESGSGSSCKNSSEGGSCLPPGNRGTVNIGTSNNSTATLSCQILNGISPSEMATLPGGHLALNAQGTLPLDGNPGISAGIKTDLDSIKGEPRVIPLFTSVTGPGNNAVYTIVGFAGVRVLDVQLTGAASSKHVTVQPATITVKGGVFNAGSSSSSTSYNISSPPWLIR